MGEVKIVADTWSLKELKPIEFPRLQERFIKKKEKKGRKEKKLCDKVDWFEDYHKITDKRHPFFETKHICVVTTESERCRAITK